MDSVMGLLVTLSLMPAHLPIPSGPFSVGRIAYHLIDQTRLELLSADRNAHRELLVYIWYPTEAQMRSVAAAPLDVRKACGFPASGPA